MTKGESTAELYAQYLSDILAGKPKQVYKKLQKQFVKKEGDTIFLQKLIDSTEEYYNKKQKSMTDQQKKAVRNYIQTLNNIQYSKSFKAKFKVLRGF